jgi:hypothetical protein
MDCLYVRTNTQWSIFCSEIYFSLLSSQKIIFFSPPRYTDFTPHAPLLLSCYFPHIVLVPFPLLFYLSSSIFVNFSTILFIPFFNFYPSDINQYVFRAGEGREFPEIGRFSETAIVDYHLSFAG